MPTNSAEQSGQTPAQQEPSKGRPFILDPLFRAVTSLAGIGPRNAKLFEKLIGGQKIFDLLCHLPQDIIDRSYQPGISEAAEGYTATLKLHIDKHQPSQRRNTPYRIRCSDETGFIELVFFHANKQWLEKKLPVGKHAIVSGRVDDFRGGKQIVHPDAIAGPDEGPEAIPPIEPVYPLTQGLSNKVVRKAMTAALNTAPDMPEWQDTHLLRREGWPAWREALETVHNPQSRTDLAPEAPARARLAYDEFLADQLALALIRTKRAKQAGRTFNTDGTRRAKFLQSLPFTLTGAQQRAAGEIDTDMASPHKMMRLLQGDVGSGKTVVAAMAMLNAIDSGAQAALMAPTEILARQHMAGLAPLFDRLGLRYVLLTGKNKGKERETLRDQIRNGAAQIVIGTHALFQEGVDFHDLGLAVIDEQHRFGVHQRLALSRKGKQGVDVLVMTATPIPRTLALTAYGDMDVSVIDEKPPGRKPVDTRLLPKDKLEGMIDRLKARTAEGARVYWVCPLVEESDTLDVSAAQERYEILQARFGDRVGLVHGRMAAEDKDAVMTQFVNGEIDILVATTVIEVGVDVPEATIMIIEHAERFGLAQLHQLRGRVGRGADQAYCFLVYDQPLSEFGRERLAVMRDTEDGFQIAEKDLELRGGGEVLGTRQSGLPDYKLADIETHADKLSMARDDAALIIQRDPDLQDARGQALRALLYLFERDQAIRYLKSG